MESRLKLDTILFVQKSELLTKNRALIIYNTNKNRHIQTKNMYMSQP